MALYYVNKKSQSTGEHEVHTGSCNWLPAPENRQYLGAFDNCTDAVREAKKYYSDVDGCAYCCPACHKR